MLRCQTSQTPTSKPRFPAADVKAPTATTPAPTATGRAAAGRSTVPEVTVPAVSLPDVQLPEVKLPTVQAPPVQLPTVQLPAALISSRAGWWQITPSCWHEWCAQARDQMLGLREQLVGRGLLVATVGDLDADLSHRARIQPSLLQLLEQPIAIRNPRRLDVDRFLGHETGVSGVGVGQTVFRASRSASSARRHTPVTMSDTGPRLRASRPEGMIAR